jgi:hypothetical protein
LISAGILIIYISLLYSFIVVLGRGIL